MASPFVDKVTITVRAGDGGNGAVTFHREKFVAAGGPDGGDGGRGGDIIFVADDNLSTLMDFRYKRKYVAENGVDGQGGRKSGKDGANLVIRVPRGTLVRDAETNEIIQDMSGSEPYVLCKGGRGGWGNMHFATPTRQVPRFAKAGLPGESHDVFLELKLLADVGLIGFPNVGKSTLLSVVSKAHPKIANYHFTTLYPNLGVVWVDEGVSFVMADIPGIIEGAAEGAGLGHDFLRHIDRCRLLVHIVHAHTVAGHNLQLRASLHDPGGHRLDTKNHCVVSLQLLDHFVFGHTGLEKFRDLQTGLPQNTLRLIRKLSEAGGEHKYFFHNRAPFA